MPSSKGSLHRPTEDTPPWHIKGFTHLVLIMHHPDLAPLPRTHC